jgi:hypothetical protein
MLKGSRKPELLEELEFYVSSAFEDEGGGYIPSNRQNQELCF